MEVDHAFYQSHEGATIPQLTGDDDEPAAPPSKPAPTAQPPSANSHRLQTLESTIGELQQQNNALADEVAELRQEIQQLHDAFVRLRTELGG